MRRRRLLGAVLAAGAAGCLELERSDDSQTRSSESAETVVTSTTTETAGATEETESSTEPTGEVTTEEEQTSEEDAYAEPLWSFSMGETRLRSPVVVDGTVFTSTRKGFAYALDADSGDRLWRSDRIGAVAGDGAPAVHGDRLLYTIEQETVALDQATGDETWRFDDGSGSGSVLDDGVLYLMGTKFGKTVAAYDAASGEERWSKEFESSYGAATVVDDVLCAATHGSDVHGIDAGSGEVLWTYPVPKDDAELASFASDGQRLLAAYGNSSGMGAGPLVALDPADGVEIWSNFEDQKTLSQSGSKNPSLVAGDGTLYVSHTGVHAVDPENGFTEWFNSDVSLSAITPANGSLYAGSTVHDGVVLLEMAADSGRVTNRLQRQAENAWGRRPSVVDETAYLQEATDEFAVSAYDLGE